MESGSDFGSSQSSISARTIDSLNEDTCQIVFQSDRKYYFEAVEGIREKAREEIIRKQRIKELQNSCLYRLKKTGYLRKYHRMPSTGLSQSRLT